MRGQKDIGPDGLRPFAGGCRGGGSGFFPGLRNGRLVEESRRTRVTVRFTMAFHSGPALAVSQALPEPFFLEGMHQPTGRTNRLRSGSARSPPATRRPPVGRQHLTEISLAGLGAGFVRNRANLGRQNPFPPGAGFRRFLLLTGQRGAQFSRTRNSEVRPISTVTK